jgi:hypothetical protein
MSWELLLLGKGWFRGGSGNLEVCCRHGRLYGHGSVRSLTSAAGALTDAYNYYAFGDLLQRTGGDAQ